MPVLKNQKTGTLNNIYVGVGAEDKILTRLVMNYTTTRSDKITIYRYKRLNNYNNKINSDTQFPY
jgi:hypothetical protein